ncbi:MAG: hypothetical protein HY761_10530 [Candidatus Omnitrophica bacterium]|nr:hypothetical protein [Candidatus Omnitrophota bacterium]
MPQKMERKTTVTVSLSISELEWLDSFAHSKGFNRSELVREWIYKTKKEADVKKNEEEQ